MDTSFLYEIRSASPDILLVAFGNPKQEKWIGMHGRSLGVPVVIGVGGSLDFVAGQTRRAPEWMQRFGFEWLFRLLQEPRRLFRRYFIDLVIFSSFFLRQWWALRPKAPGLILQSPSLNLALIQGKAVLDLHGCLNVNTVDALHRIGQQALAASQHVLVNLAQVKFLDSSAIGALLELGNQARFAGGELSLAAVPARIQQTLALLQMEKIFNIYPNLEAYLTEWASKSASIPPVAAERVPSPSGIRSWTILKGYCVLDASTVQDFIEAGTSALAANPFLICDLSETIFLASAGLAALTKLRQMALNLHGELRVVNCSPDAARVIRNAHFDRVLPLYSNFSLAIA
jgi:N-acetylglucosaminyldiphosphoundecaprenol N-acetyl-beta-D-mannosaminyltransferase